MSDKKFLNSIYEVAERLVKRELTSEEKSKLIKNFIESLENTAHLKAIDALEKEFGRILPRKPNQVLLEKTAHFDDINNKLTAMRAEAEKWEQEENDSDESNN